MHVLLSASTTGSGLKCAGNPKDQAQRRPLRVKSLTNYLQSRIRFAEAGVRKVTFNLEDESHRAEEEHIPACSEPVTPDHVELNEMNKAPEQIQASYLNLSVVKVTDIESICQHKSNSSSL